jgi:hypothetical protein
MSTTVKIKNRKRKRNRVLLLISYFLDSGLNPTKIRPSISCVRYNFAQSSNNDVLHHFRFDKIALKKLESLLRIPPFVTLPQRSIILGFDAFLMTLKRFAMF